MKFAKLNHAKNLKCLVLTLPSYHLLPFQSGVSPKNPPQHPKSLHRAMVANFRPTFGRSQQTWLSRNTAIVAANFMVRVLASGGLVYYGLLRGGGGGEHLTPQHLNRTKNHAISPYKHPFRFKVNSPEKKKSVLTAPWIPTKANISSA